MHLTCALNNTHDERVLSMNGSDFKFRTTSDPSRIECFAFFLYSSAYCFCVRGQNYTYFSHRSISNHHFVKIVTLIIFNFMDILTIDQFVNSIDSVDIRRSPNIYRTGRGREQFEEDKKYVKSKPFSHLQRSHLSNNVLPFFLACKIYNAR